MVGSAQRLADALRTAGAPASLCDRALAGAYDDFQSSLPFPKIALVAELNAVKMERFAARVIAGEFDSTREEAESWFAEKRENLRAWKRIQEDISDNGNPK